MGTFMILEIFKRSLKSIKSSHEGIALTVYLKVWKKMSLKLNT